MHLQIVEDSTAMVNHVGIPKGCDTWERVKEKVLSWFHLRCFRKSQSLPLTLYQSTAKSLFEKSAGYQVSIYI